LELPADDLKIMLKEAVNNEAFDPLLAINNKVSSIKAATNERGLNQIKRVLSEKEYENFMEYLGKVATDNEITELLNIDNLKRNPVIESEIREMNFLSEDFSEAR